MIEFGKENSLLKRIAAGALPGRRKRITILHGADENLCGAKRRHMVTDPVTTAERSADVP